jgi:hypothetical protein
MSNVSSDICNRIADAIGRALYQLQLIEVELDVVINWYAA